MQINIRIFFVVMSLAFTGHIPLFGQWRVIHFEGYINYTDHRAMLFQSEKNCETIDFRDFKGKKPAADALVCYEQAYNDSVPVPIYEREGVGLYVDHTGAFYCIDNMVERAKPLYLEERIQSLLLDRKEVVIEVDDTDPFHLIIRAIPFSDYKLGRLNSKGATQLLFSYETIVYSTRGLISPSVIAEIQEAITIFPEDGKTQDEILFHVPVSKSALPCPYSIYIYDLKGNILHMHTDLLKDDYVLRRENLTSGTYRYTIFLSNGTVEIKKGMLNFREPPKPE